MAKPRRAAEKPGVPVVRRKAEERKRLPPEMEAFARGEADRLPRRPREPTEPRLRDPRPSPLVPGVATRDARIVADARIEELTRLLAAETRDDATIAGRLAEARALGVHRGRSLTGFDALTLDVLGLERAEVGRLLALAPETPSAFSEAGIASALRAEAALLENGYRGRVSLHRDASGREHVVLDVPVKHAAEALEAVGERMRPLARDRRTP